MTSASVPCHGFLLPPSSHVTGIFLLIFLHAALAGLQDMFYVSDIRPVAWLQIVSAYALLRGFLSFFGNLRGVTRTLRRNGDAFLSPRRSSQQARRGPPAMLAFRVHSGVLHFIVCLRAKQPGPSSERFSGCSGDLL